MEAGLLERLLGMWPRENWEETRLLVAVSGGADSVALLHALVNASPDREFIEAAHFNHCWRGDESEGDQESVVALCNELQVACTVGRADQTTGLPEGKSEENAREVRYDFLASVAYEVGARYVVMAHTATDRVETVLHNLFRGTGLSGVSTPTFMRPMSEELVLVRPLLGCTRQHVLDYCNENDLQYRHDSSNDDETYRRNFLRNSLLPLIREQYGEHVDEKIWSFSKIAEEAHDMHLQLASDFLKQAETAVREAAETTEFPKLDNTLFVLPCMEKFGGNWTIVRQALQFVWKHRQWPLKSMNRSNWDRIRAVWESPSAEFDSAAWMVLANLPGNLQLCRKDQWILIRQFENNA